MNDVGAQSCLTRGTRRYISTIALLLAAGLAAGKGAHADEAEAKVLFKKMSDYLAAQNLISFEYDSSLELVTTEDQKISFASSGSVTMNRPDKIEATRVGGFVNVEMVFDGKTLSILGRNANVYAQADVPGTIDNLIDELRDKFHKPMPAADLLMSDVNDQLMPLVTDVKDLGSGFVRGEECDHLAFRTEEADFQIWIHQGEQPYPCRYVITTTKVKGWPEYAIDVRNWKTGSEVAAVDFVFEAPDGAKMLNADELRNLDELPSQVVKGVPQ